jgi:hypothetical protein
MKPLKPLLITIITLGGFGEAVPFQAGLEATTEWLTRRAPPDKKPAYTTISLAPQATSYHFYSEEGWKDDASVKSNEPAKAVLSKMNKDGLFTAVIMRGAKTSCVGVAKGKTKPNEFVLSNAKDAENCLVTNGGFFVTGGDPYLRTDYNGALLDSSSIMYYSVGDTSVSHNKVPVPGAHADLYHKLQGDDGSFLTCGPDLRKAVDGSDPDHTKANKMANRLHYFAKDWRGDKIHSPVWDELVKHDQAVHQALIDNSRSGKGGASVKNELEHLDKLGRTTFSVKEVEFCDGATGSLVKETLPVRAATDGASDFIRSVFAHIPGGVATVNERNERNVLIFVGGDVKVVCAYTSTRKLGMRINEMRDVIDQFLESFLSKRIGETEMALNLDGGASIFLGWVKNGKLRILATGGLDKQKAVPYEPESVKFRDVTTMVKHVLEGEDDGKKDMSDSKKHPADKDKDTKSTKKVETEKNSDKRKTTVGSKAKHGL